ncbi:MAG: VWA domain-containing protein [Deltaproteobacteria bacterium]|nr:VWA domain-containing protein [Deltaproteobacteria bacterium]
MFLEFFEELRRHKVPVSTHEWLTLAKAMSLGLHDSSLNGFYSLARSICVKDIAHYDAFDAAFLKTFRGIESSSLRLTEEMSAWLEDPVRRRELSDEERALLSSLDLDQLRELFEKRMREQRERHDGGERWIGTGGTSPFGSQGYNPSGLRIGDSAGGRSAMQVASQRRFREYRKDLVLDVRRIDVALRLLRDLGREGAPEELALEETIDRTAKNAGELEVVTRPRERNRTKLLLLMDVGGSMDPHARLLGQLFSAASRAGRFARFRHFYFHNCVYESVYEDAQFYKAVMVADLLSSTDREEKLVVVGDASMHPTELLSAGGTIYFYHHNRTPGIEWMRRLAEHFRRSAWLNPEPEQYWGIPSVDLLRHVFPMFPLTIDGLDAAVKHLLRGTRSPLPTQ